MKGEQRKDNKDIRDSQDTCIKRHTDTLQKNLTNWREAYSIYKCCVEMEIRKPLKDFSTGSILNPGQFQLQGGQGEFEKVLGTLNAVEGFHDFLERLTAPQLQLAEAM